MFTEAREKVPSNNKDKKEGTKDMSAYMMPAKTTAIIAEYLAAAANSVGHMGTIEGVKTIEPPKELIKCLKEAGCYNAEYDEYKADKIYEVMSNYNESALKERYGEEDAKGMSGAFEPFVSQHIDIKEDTRRQWLSNLFTVARCHHYQCAEGMVCESAFFKAFGEWVDGMAYGLAEFVVDEVRPRYRKMGDEGNWKPWDVF